jgi:hypothetical protein
MRSHKHSMLRKAYAMNEQYDRRQALLEAANLVHPGQFTAADFAPSRPSMVSAPRPPRKHAPPYSIRNSQPVLALLWRRRGHG